ncbi:hypothetical protein O181_038290 [Austropuccinia psidii MF-1]|uniref:Uncharacterized protein n=1 Tax=Austropuccinia psidii MF-1 TaxID=1389203 RepID=A0A9Q3DCL5_9BASI|nr:hypothetical protein [Austropuccinia psidii MF-1]
MTLFPPLRIFLHLSITFWPAWIRTDFSEFLGLLDHCSTDLFSELSEFEPLPYPSNPHEDYPLIREAETIPSKLPFHPNPNLRINEKGIYNFQEKRPSNHFYDSRFTYEHSRNKQLPCRASWVPQFQSQAHILPPNLLGASPDRNHISQSSNTHGKEIFKSEDSFEKSIHQASEYQYHPLTSNTQGTFGSFLFPSELEHGGKPNTGSELRRQNFLTDFQPMDFVSDQSAYNQVFDGPRQSSPYENQPHFEIFNSVVPLENRNNMDMANNSPRKKLSAYVNIFKLNNEKLLSPQLSNENVERISTSEFYQPIVPKSNRNFGVELDSFLKIIKQKYSPKNADFFGERLSFIMKLSLVRSKHYALLYQKVDLKDQEALRKNQKETFEFLKYFWRLTLVYEEDCNSQYHDMEKLILTAKFLKEARVAFESLSRDYATGEWASWYGIKAFVSIHWKAILEKPQKNKINNNIRCFNIYHPDHSGEEKLIQMDTLSLHQKHLSNDCHFANLARKDQNSLLISRTKIKGEAALDKLESSLEDFLKVIEKRNDESQIFKRITTKAIKKRITYALIASFLHLHIYGSLGLPIRLPEDFLIDFKTKVFRLQQYFWELVLFQKAIFPSDLISTKPNLTNSMAVENARKPLQQIYGASEQKAESASWHASEFFIFWLWGHKLTSKQKTEIKNAIIAQERPVRMQELAEASKKFFSEKDRSHNILFHKPQQTHRRLVSSCTESLGNTALKNHELRLKQFLKLILMQYKYVEEEFKNKKKDLILNRASFVMTACFIQIQEYSSLKLGVKLREDAVKDFEEKVFQLLRYFWELVFFGKGVPPSQYPEIGENIKKSDEFTRARESLSNCAGGDETARNASWHATKFLIRWLWNQKLSNKQKGVINDKIKSKGKVTMR